MSEQEIQELEKPAEQQEEAQQEAQSEAPNVEAEARELGWVPQGEFKGDPSKWRPADEFVKRGREILPIVNAQNRKLQSEVRDLKGQISQKDQDYATRLERMERMNQITLEQAKDHIKREFSKEKRAAVREGDEERFTKLEVDEAAALTELDRRAAPPEKADAKPDIPPEVQTEIDSWKSDNRWFEADADMRQTATAYHGYLMQTKPGLSLKENLAMVRDHIKNEFPSKFANGSAHRGSPVESGARGGNGSGKTLWSKIPDADREAAKRQLSDGAFKYGDDGKELSQAQRQEEWARVYFGGEA